MGALLLIGTVVVMTAVLLIVGAVLASIAREDNGNHRSNRHRGADSGSNTHKQASREDEYRRAGNGSNDAGAAQVALRDIESIINGRRTWVNTSDQVREVLRSVDY